jgi:hypothetical protein
VNDVKPVPPDVVGNAVPDKVNANVPLVVMGEPAIDKNVGTVAATLVTVPKGFDAHELFEPSVVRYLPLLPVWLGARALKAALAVVWPVPPFKIGNVPVTPVDNGRPVAFVRFTDAGVFKIAPVPNVATPVTPNVDETVAAPVTVKAPVATARPAVRFATLTCLVVLLCTMGKTSVPARGVVLAGSAEILVFAMMYQS